MKKAIREVGKTSQRLKKKECMTESEGETADKGYRNGRMRHYGRRNVFDEWPFYHIKPEQWSIMCYCAHCVINLPLSGNADTTDRPQWKAGSTWKEKVQLDKKAAEIPFGLITLDFWKCFMIWRQVALAISGAAAIQGEYCKILIIYSRSNQLPRK